MGWARINACEQLYDTLTPAGSRLSGSADVNLGFTARPHSTTKKGLAVDLSLNEYVVEKCNPRASRLFRKRFEPPSCFAAGTLVHTKEGLVPIEQVKVGDRVVVY